MSRDACEKLTGRIYKQHLQSSGGRLPTGKETRAIEKKAQRVAERTDRKAGNKKR